MKQLKHMVWHMQYGTRAIRYVYDCTNVNELIHIQYSLINASVKMLTSFQGNEPEQGDEEERIPLPPWVKSLTEENSQLHEANQQLWAEKQQLQQEAHQERKLVKQCFDQLGMFNVAKL